MILGLEGGKELSVFQSDEATQSAPSSLFQSDEAKQSAPSSYSGVSLKNFDPPAEEGSTQEFAHVF